VTGDRRRHRGIAQQRRFQLLHYGVRDLLLHLVHAAKVLVEGFRPLLESVVGTHELRADAQVIAKLAHAAFQHVRRTQRTVKIRDRRLAVCRMREHAARRHSQLGHVREQMADLLRHGDGKLPEIFFLGHVHERQHRDRLVAHA